FRWERVGHALRRPDASLGLSFWAPEVAVRDGRCFMYYSVGHEDRAHQLRVAISADPVGPYEDAGVALVDPAACPFAIDPHPFRDDDGQWYLFYARDFLDSGDQHRPGTALVVDRLVDMTSLAGEPRTVLRACFDWQRFQSERAMYGGLYDWHTLEGPCVRKHAGRYYCFYSGGRWESDGYGVDYGVADTVLGPYRHPATCDRPRVLATVPGHVLGPGHNSIVRGPDDETDFIVYHAWGSDMRERRMYVAPLRWGADGPRCQGPTRRHARVS
ncbi:MAG: glycoside hydrolase family 43 protein, partial [Candidatus Rokuibacteriota bacterium]